jgi:hypothetical protein
MKYKAPSKGTYLISAGKQSVTMVLEDQTTYEITTDESLNILSVLPSEPDNIKVTPVDNHKYTKQEFREEYSKYYREHIIPSDEIIRTYFTITNGVSNKLIQDTHRIVKNGKITIPVSGCYKFIFVSSSRLIPNNGIDVCLKYNGEKEKVLVKSLNFHDHISYRLPDLRAGDTLELSGKYLDIFGLQAGFIDEFSVYMERL